MENTAQILKISSFAELLNHSSTTYCHRDAFRIRFGKGFQSIDYTSLRDNVFNTAASLTNKGFNGQKIALLGENSYHWVVAYLGTVVSANVIVPIDKELTAPEIANLLSQSQADAVFCSEDYIEILEETGFKKSIFVINQSENQTYTSLEYVIEEGLALRCEKPLLGQNETSPDTLSTIVFTSGTTGFSKGVMLSRRNILSNILDTDKFIKLRGSTLSLLPMNHTYEFTLDILLPIYQGVTVCINNGIKYFQQNLQIFRPVNLVIVPLIADNLLKSIWKKIEEENKLKKVQRALIISRFLLKIGIDIRRKIFAPIHASLGGCVEQFFIGGARLDPASARQLYDFGFQVNIGYGITECSPFVSGNITNDPRYFASCGVAIPNVTVNIDNPNELGEGEIVVQGPNVMLGYYENNIETAKVVDDKGFHTGDIGRKDKQGRLYITGRIKNLIVLNNGKNVYPEELESLIYQQTKDVKEVVVSATIDGQNGETQIIAEIYVDPDTFHTNQDVITQIKNNINKLNETLPYFKRVVEVKFRDTEFPKTTTKKIKRY